MTLISQQVKELLDSQLKEWELAKANYDALAKVESKEFSFGEFSVTVQFNPARIQSSAAKVDAKSIQERKCFLCPNNLPVVQKGIPFGKEYQILVNPFPIFPQHYTIPTYQHTDQLILDRYTDMLDLAKELPDCVIFYNGPKCGASAPDHAHFQAGNKGFLPLEKDMKTVSKESIYENTALKVFAVRNYLRNSFLFEAERKEDSVIFFKRLYSMLDFKEEETEPMMNIVAWYDNNKSYTWVLPRAVHRPACFFAEGDDNILISPASVDLGGVLITPLEKDFKKITADDICNILKEVCIDDDKMQSIINNVKNL